MFCLFDLFSLTTFVCDYLRLLFTLLVFSSCFFCNHFLYCLRTFPIYANDVNKLVLWLENTERQSKIKNLEKVETQVTQDEEKQNKTQHNMCWTPLAICHESKSGFFRKILVSVINNQRYHSISKTYLKSNFL